MSDGRHDGYGFWVRAYFPAEVVALPEAQFDKLLAERLKVMADTVRNAAEEYRAKRQERAERQASEVT